MSAPKFTPGPWRAGWSMAGCWLVYCHNDPNRQHNTHFSPEREADAHLIAAAPELYEALCLCYEHCLLYHPEVETNNVGKQVRAALAKAGQS